MVRREVFENYVSCVSCVSGGTAIDMPLGDFIGLISLMSLISLIKFYRDGIHATPAINLFFCKKSPMGKFVGDFQGALLLNGCRNVATAIELFLPSFFSLRKKAEFVGENEGADVVTGDIAGGFKHIEEGVDTEGESDDGGCLGGREVERVKNEEEEEDASAGDAAGTDGGEDDTEDHDDQLTGGDAEAE